MGNKTTSYETQFSHSSFCLKEKGIFDQFVPFLSGFFGENEKSFENHRYFLNCKTIDRIDCAI